MTIPRHHNYGYAGGSPNIPLDTGDNFYAQDQIRDFWYLLDRASLFLRDTSVATKSIFSGGVLGHGGFSYQLTITSLIGYVPYSVNVPSNAALPPTIAAADVDFIRMNAAPGTVDVRSYGTVLDGVTLNYVKIAYTETDGLSRTRAKLAGSYPFERQPFYLLTISPVAPTAYELCLGEIVGTVGAFVITYVNRSPEFGTMDRTAIKAISANYVILDNDSVATVLVTTAAATINLTLPLSANNKNRRIKVKKVDSGTGTVNIITTSSELIDEATSFNLGGFNDILEVVNDGSKWQVMAHNPYAKDVDLTVTGLLTWVTTRARGQAYQTRAGAWRLRFNIAGTNLTGNPQTLTITGIVFKNGYDQAVAMDTGATPVGGRAVSNTNTITLRSNNSTQYICSGDVELNAKPSWA